METKDSSGIIAQISTKFLSMGMRFFSFKPPRLQHPSKGGESRSGLPALTGIPQTGYAVFINRSAKSFSHFAEICAQDGNLHGKSAKLYAQDAKLHAQDGKLRHHFGILCLKFTKHVNGFGKYFIRLHTSAGFLIKFIKILLNI